MTYQILSRYVPRVMIWKILDRQLDLSRQAHVMGILNLTPDSFSDGGRFDGREAALSHARSMIEEGASIIDIGGESSRPGALPISVQEEIKRTIPVIEILRQEWAGMISIDTTKADVAKAALRAGADIVNDISGLRADSEMMRVCADSNCGIVVMHMLGTPANMQKSPQYEDVIEEVSAFFRERVSTLSKAGIAAERLCFDPGIGFGKTQEHNLALLRNLEKLAPAGFPLLLGISRKSFIGKITGTELPVDRDHATISLSAIARMSGVMLHRVHEVRGNLAALRMAEALFFT